MNVLRFIHRLLYIQFVLVRNGVDDVLTQHPRLWLFRIFVYINPFYWFARKQARAVAIRRSMEELGPIFVKFGQALSTRPDLLPKDMIRELSKLQDKVPPFPSEQVVEKIEHIFHRSIDELFLEFDRQPLASASIAQVHAARLPQGQQVVVKVLRPEIKKIIHNDLRILFTLARLMEKYLPMGRRLKPIEVVQEFKHSILDELDFNREAANAAQLRRNFSNSSLLYVPEIYWDYVREEIMVIERIDAIPVNDVMQLDAYGVDRKKLAERGIEIFFTQVFRDCYFHADMHPGNIFVSKTKPNEPQYICIDFGIMGTLTQNDQYYLAENLLAFFNRDYQKVASLHIASGWIPANTRAEDFAAAIRTVCEPIFEKPLKDISFGLLMMRLFQVARRFHMEVQPQLILLQKTLLAVEGLGRQIYPELDLWKTAKPFLASWVKQQLGPKALWKNCREQLPFLVKTMPMMPSLVYEVLQLSKQSYLGKTKPSIQQEVRDHTWIKGLGAILVLSGLGYLGMHLPQTMSKTEYLSYLFGLSSGLIAGLVLCSHSKSHKG